MQNMSILIIDGNPIRSIRRDIINRGTEAIKKYLISRMSEDDGPKKDELNVKDGPNNMGVFGDSNEVDPHDIGRTQSLELNNKELASIHPDVWLSLQHINLKVVHLKRNKFQKIPPEIFNYSKSLVTLDISVNKLTVLPEELGLLTNLQHLDVSSNRISKVPVSLGKLVKMRHIDLSLNSFTEIPEVVLTLHNLEHLFFNSNDIKEIDVNGIIKLARLKTLDLQNNNLENVPPELGLCDQLTCLKLEGNCFRIPRPQLLSKGTGAVLEYLRGRIPR